VGHGKVVALGLLGAVIALPVLVVLGVVVLTLAGVTHLYRVPSLAMEPTLHAGARVFAVKYMRGSPGRSDIVAVHPPASARERCGTSGVYVMRIVGLPGETLQEQKGRVYIDRQLLRERYVEQRDTSNGRRVRIPKGSYFVLGDNRPGSCDSRRWGPVPRASIIGRVIATYWPPSRIALH
jgi:signal peptidase I